MNTGRIEMPLVEQKMVMLNILVSFAEFCENNCLRYFLDAGTLLGAVRHKGFIPWDNDVDVNMPVADYDQFIALTQKTNGYIAPHIFVEFPKDTIYPFLKISDDRTILVEFPNKYPMEVGVYIDVFPKVGLLDDSIFTKFLCARCAFLGYVLWFNKFSIYAWKDHGNVVQKIIAAVGRKVIKTPNRPAELQDKLIHRYMKKHPLSECKYVTTLTNGEFGKRANKECFESFIMIEFEGNNFRAPKRYDEYLPCLYGSSYMVLPPEEKRVSHNILAYWKSDSMKAEFMGEIDE